MKSFLLITIIYPKTKKYVLKTTCIGNNLPTYVRENTDFPRENPWQLPSAVANFEGCKYVVLFHSDEEHEIISDRKLIMLTSIILDVDSCKYTKIEFNSGDHLSLEETLNMHNPVIFADSGFNKNHNHYYYQTLLEKCSYK